jgi:hypothetical protein
MVGVSPVKLAKPLGHDQEDADAWKLPTGERYMPIAVLRRRRFQGGPPSYLPNGRNRSYPLLGRQE